MTRYMQIAGEANKTAKALFDLVKEPEKVGEEYEGQVAIHIARLVNYGLRCAPRAVQGTVRLNAVKEAVKGLPVKVHMEKKEDEQTGKSYNYLVTEPIQYGSK